MAIIKLGTIVVGIRGTLGGITYSANKSGNYAKAWVYPRRPSNPKQTDAQNQMTRLPDAWRNLSAAQRTAWDTFAAAPAQQLTNTLGVNYFISGFQWFMKINLWAFAIGFTLRANAPTVAKPAAPALTAATISTGPTACNITYAGTPFGTSDSIVVFCRNWPTTTANAPAGTQKLTSSAFNPGASPYTFTTGYLANFGAPQVGQRVFCSVHNQNSQGYRSDGTLLVADVT